MQTITKSRETIRVLDASSDTAVSIELLRPSTTKPCPLVIWIHGGGWASGDNLRDLDLLAPHVLSMGYGLASIGYRLTPQKPFPAQALDCGAALAWLHQHAFEKGLDPARFAVAGHSAGGHLTAWLGLGAQSSLFGEARWPRPAAVACWSPPLDLDRERGAWPRDTFPWNPSDRFCKSFFPGGAYDCEFARLASPASYSLTAMPPCLIAHGTADDIVPIGQAQTFANQLREAEGACEFLTLKDADHHIVTAELLLQTLRFFGQSFAT